MPGRPVAKLSVQRLVTSTPLAREHDQVVLQGRSRRHKPVSFARFERKEYPKAAVALALEAQKALALGEYTAVDLFAHVASTLALNAAPFDIVAAATRVPADEIRHADLALRMAGLLAGHDVEIEVDREALDAPVTKATDRESLDVLMVHLPAISETLAYALLSACRDRARDPTVKAVYKTIVADEVHHARLGWYYLAWRAPQWTQAERQRVADRCGGLIADTEHRFWRGRDAPASASEAARALGVLESEGQREAVRQVMEDEIVPGLDAIGLGASHAWRARRRGR
jgi:hypothetical protein